MKKIGIRKSLRSFQLGAFAALVALSSQAQKVVVNLTAQRSSLALPDGKTAPMWEFCTTPANGAACQGQWAPGPTIVVPVGQELDINLTNNLPTETSIVILAQLGGGLGQPTKVDSPVHSARTNTTWPTNSDGTFTPPAQGTRVRTFGIETAPGGPSQKYTWTNLKAGTYLYETGTHPSIQAPMGLYGVIVVTNTPVSATTSTALTPGKAYPGAFTHTSGLTDVPYDADAVMLLSEIDLAQNTAVDSLCPASGPCTTIDPLLYPPAVNYAPTYFLMNGQPFNRTSPTGIPIPVTVASGDTLLRFVNAGLKTHVPSAVGLNMQLVAEDGNVLPGKPKVQNEVLLPAGKTEDVLVNLPTTSDPASGATVYAAKAYGVFDRQLSLSAGNMPDSGIQTFLQVGGASLPSGVQPQVVADTFAIPNDGSPFNGNVLLNDVAVYSAAVVQSTVDPTAGTVAMNTDGSFVFTPKPTVSFPVSFQYCGNGSTTANMCTTVTLTAGAATLAPTAQDDTFNSNIATAIKIPNPGVLANDEDPAGYPLTAKLVEDPTTNAVPSWVTLNPDGSFTATGTGGGSVSFTYVAVNSHGIASAPATVTVNFPSPSNLAVSVVDAIMGITVSDYRWTIEEDTTFHNNLDQPTAANPAPSTIAVNFHKSYMPIVATGCVGPISCGQGQAVGGQDVNPSAETKIGDVHLDPNKHYYISVLPGDAANAFIAGSGAPVTDKKTGKTRQFDITKDCAPDTCGHTMGGASIAPGQSNAKVLVETNPLQTAQLSIFVFEDNSPTNGDIDGNEESQGLGGFQITINDTAGRTGDPAGQIVYDAFNMPLTNALIGTPDCPYIDSTGQVLTGNAAVGAMPIGIVLTCPEVNPRTNQRYALAGQALIKNIMPGRFDVFANPGAGRAQKGETWYQVSTLEGTHANDAFAKSGEPAYFQEFGPPGYHAFIGFVSPDHIEAIHKQLASAAKSTHSIRGTITNLHMSRPVAETLYSGSHDPISQTTCYVGLNSQSGSGANVAFTKCDQNGNFTLANIPDGSYQIVVWDEWLDLIIEYKDVTVAGEDVNMHEVPAFSWFTRIETSTFMDDDGTHKPDKNPGVGQVPTTIRFRDGSFSNKLVTDSGGNATFDELFPLFNWYVLESDTTRFKGSAVHVVVDGGGQPDQTGPYAGILNSTYPTGEKTERVDDGKIQMEGVQGFINQTEITDWGKKPYQLGENGGITGTVVYSSTRPFDDPSLLFQNLWEPLVPRVTVRLYQEMPAPDGTNGLKFIESTTTTSWDDVANSTDSPMVCPGQRSDDPFVSATLGSNINKCYDGFHAFNQVQPAVYDGRYNFTNLTDGSPLPAGRYVVEMVLPTGYELVKEEDKNILIGDAWIAPVTQQFGGLGNIFILPDQAEVGSGGGNPNNPNNPTVNEGRTDGGLLFPPCVGSMHRVPDFLTLFPQSGQVAPFAGEDRPLCDRKEVTITDQQQSNADFFVFTAAHIAGHYTGMILNDAASEMNAASPDFGEKFAVPNIPISFKDFNGIEISRTYADQWGNFNGLTPSSWEVNVPNPAGYSPNMLIECMNDPGPIADPATGKMITDPHYNPMYSNFCYTNAFMPGLTDYLDTPVLPVSAFATGYNQTDCAYPDATPAISRVDSSAGFGPYLTTAGGTLTIAALGNKVVPNPAYMGPMLPQDPKSANTQKTITRHYGFGTQGQKSKITIGGADVTAKVTTWTDDSIILNLPANSTGGQLIITADNGKSSVDAVTVTIENRVPVRVDAAGSGQYSTIQPAIEAANPGDLILVNAGSYNELVIMWKPVRLQGVGATSVIINAAKYPTNKLEAWRPHINQLFNIDANGNQLPNSQVDPLPGQEITGGVVLLEPSVLGQEEGAGITVLAKNGTASQCRNASKTNPSYVSNFNCNPSRIDGISVTGGDAGGGIFVNGWAHNIEIANNRVYGNAGSFHGGIRVGVPYLEGLTGGGFGFNKNVHIHHNSVTNNGTVEANAGDSGAGGGVSICSGTDNYLLNFNFVCGNFASTDGGGIGHIGVSDGGMIANNIIAFNQSYAQSNTVHGGGITIEGENAVAGGVTLGTGNVIVDSNIIQGNFAESGSGGGIRLQGVNGAEISCGTLYKVTVTNNIIVNNVAGWAGGGISLADTLNSSIINNTIASNDSVGIVGGLFNIPGNPTTAYPNPAGIVSEPTTPQLAATLGQTQLPAAQRAISNPQLINNIIWQNRSFYFDAASGTAQDCASNNYADAPAHTCGTQPTYWDLGILGDQTTTPGVNNKLNPTASIITSTAGYDASNISSDPQFNSTYFNSSTAVPGLLLPPEAYAAFATLDEGGNFVDLSYGPLTISGDYRVQASSPAIDKGASTFAPSHDMLGTTRPQGLGYDIGAYEYPVPQSATLSPDLNFGNVQYGQTPSPQLVATLTNTGSGPLTFIAISFGKTSLNPYSQINTCGTTLGVGGSCKIAVTFTPTTKNTNVNNTLIVTDGAGTQTVNLIGTGTNPSATLLPAILTLNVVPRGQTSPYQVATLTNTGSGPLTVQSTVFSPGTSTTQITTQFKLIATPSGQPTACAANATLAAGATCNYYIVNAPTSNSGTLLTSGTFRVTDNAGTQIVNLTVK